MYYNIAPVKLHCIKPLWYWYIKNGKYTCGSMKTVDSIPL